MADHGAAAAAPNAGLNASRDREGPAWHYRRMTSPQIEPVPDRQTVSRDGKSTLPTIDGVLTRTPPTHVDHRGALFELYANEEGAWAAPVVHVYQTSLFPGVIKGWNQHDSKTDRYTISSGEILVVLWDDREDSPTRGVVQHVALSPRGIRQMLIPVGVWHLLLNLGTTEAFLINLPTDPYRHEAPDRRLLPWDSDAIPVDVRALLPQF